MLDTPEFKNRLPHMSLDELTRMATTDRSQYRQEDVAMVELELASRGVAGLTFGDRPYSLAVPSLRQRSTGLMKCLFVCQLGIVCLSILGGWWIAWMPTLPGGVLSFVALFQANHAATQRTQGASYPGWYFPLAIATILMPGLALIMCAIAG